VTILEKDKGFILRRHCEGRRKPVRW